MRIPVSVVVGQIAHGASWDEVLQGYPDLEREDIPQSLEYAGVLAEARQTEDDERDRERLA